MGSPLRGSSDALHEIAGEVLGAGAAAPNPRNVDGGAPAGANKLDQGGGKADQQQASPFTQKCEMCGGRFGHPVTFHMRSQHPGCGGPAWGMGYNSSGHYYGGWVGSCGDGGTDMSTYYLMCVRCRDMYINQAAPGGGGGGGEALKEEGEGASKLDRRGLAQAKKKVSRQHPAYSKTGASQQAVLTPTGPGACGGSNGSSHSVMNNNAMFLLELASAWSSTIRQPSSQQV